MSKEYEVLAGLNDQQKEAAMHIDGPALVTATAGAGKTRVVVTRAQHMIKDMGIDPSLILLTTFTNKAANEMKERIISVVGERGKKITVGTYHSICNRILRQYCTYIGYVKTFTILDADDSEKVMKEIAKDFGEDYASLKTYISNCKINCKTPAMAQAEAQEKNTTRLSNCYQAYQDKLKRDQCMDFDDLLLNTVLLLESEPAVKEQVNNKWQYVSADETQDSSELDSRLMYALSGPNHNIFFVGDDDQCLIKGTMIETKEGKKPIEDITKNDELIVACGDGRTTPVKPASISKKMTREEVYVIKTESGKELKATGNHIVFSRIAPQKRYYVYLMYKEGYGFRIGTTSGIGTRKGVQKCNSFETRLNQEKADKIWLIKDVDTLDEALYYENYYSYEYGIPQYVFNYRGQSGMSQDHIRELFNNIDTETRALKLLNDLGMYLNYPHHVPQSSSKNTERKNITFTMFGNRRSGYSAKHEITMCSTNKEFYKDMSKVFKTGCSKINKNATEYYTVRKTSIEYDNLMDLMDNAIETLEDKNYNYNILMKARLLKDNTTCNFTPVSHLVVGAKLYILNNDNEIVEDTITSITKEFYYDYVYDINVDNYRNYIANNIVVHNCIYSFRGSDVTIILNLKSKYPNLKWYNLGVNYRSTSNIVDAGQEIIKHNKNKLQKEVSCGKNIQGAPIIISETRNQEQEAKRVVTFIKTLHNRSSMPVPYKEMAILYRMSHLSRIFEKELMKAKIKYKLVGGTPFFSRMEVKDILSYARLTVNQFDVQSFKRSIAIPKRGIGDKSIEKIESFMVDNTEADMSIRKALTHKDLPLKGKAKKGIEEYNKLLEDFDDKKVELSPEEFIKYIIQKLDYLTFMKESKEYKDNYEERVENLNELVAVAKEFNNIEDLLVEASIFQEQDNVGEDEDAVQLMTIHKSKGLEFDAVFMTNTVEGTLPHYKSLEDPAQLEEERRVMFVGCTRARKNLFITYPKKQMVMNTEKYVKRSRFINEINKKHVKVI